MHVLILVLHYKMYVFFLKLFLCVCVHHHFCVAVKMVQSSTLRVVSDRKLDIIVTLELGELK